MGDGGTPAETAGVRLQFPGQDLEQGRFGEAVVAYESDLVPLAHGEGKVVEYGDPVDGLGKPFDLQNDVAAGAFGLEQDVRILPGRDGHVLKGQLFQELLSRSSLFGLGCVGTEALDEFRQFVGFFGEFTVLVLLLFQRQLAGLVPEVVVADVDLYPAEVDVRHVRADLVEEMPGVGNHGRPYWESGRAWIIRSCIMTSLNLAALLIPPPDPSQVVSITWEDTARCFHTTELWFSLRVLP